MLDADRVTSRVHLHAGLGQFVRCQRAVLAKAVTSLGGIMRTLRADVDLIGLVRPLMEGIVRERLAPEQWLSEGSGVASMRRTAPA